MRITKVYTKGGDKGQTSLVGGTRVAKTHPRIQSYGSTDELNAILGLIRCHLQQPNTPEQIIETIDPMLYRIQNDLFNVGADLATPTEFRWKDMIRVNEDSVLQIEKWIDTLNESLPPLKEFILPGGGIVGAFFHQARTVCRRAERDILSLMENDESVEPGPLMYLNRLSDFLFVAGRWAAKELGEKEFFWQR